MDKLSKLETELKQIPSTFDLLVEVEQFPRDYLIKVREKLIEECEATPYDTEMEKLRAWNLISFLYFVLGKEDLAHQFNSKVVDLCPDNIVGLCNKAWFQLKNKDFFNVNAVLGRLKEMCARRNNILIAKAEKAFCYSRFGIKMYEKSGNLFEDVLKECIDPTYVSCYSGETSVSKLTNCDIPTEIIAVWTFGYALTLKRMLNISNVHDQSSFDISRQRHVMVCKLYSCIIKLDGMGECLKRYKARAYAEIGMLAYDVCKNKDRFPHGLKDILPDNTALRMDTKNYFLSALHLCPTDVFVLERSGKYFRYIGDIGASIKYLAKAIGVRETAFAHHHLALSLKRQIEQPSYNLRRQASRNLFPKSRNKRDSVYEQTTGTRQVSDRSFSTGSTKEQQKTGSFVQYHREDRHSIDKDYTTKLKAEKKSETEKYIRDNFTSGCDNLSSSLQLLSLDSAYESMPKCSVSHYHYEEARPSPHRSMESDGRNQDKKSRERTPKSRSDSAFLQYRGQDYSRDDGRPKFGKYYKASSNERGVFSGSSPDHTKKHTGKVNPRSPMPEQGQAYSELLLNTRSQSAKSTCRSEVVRMVKSPQKPKYIDMSSNGETVEKILFHLNKSIEMANNCGAIYDKGLLYRQVHQPRKALDSFKILMKNRDGYCSLMQLSNAYEQAGLCLYDLLDETAEESEDDFNGYQYDMRQYFKMSIEISCKLVAKIPFLKDCWTSAPTLYNFLSGKPKTKDKLEDLSFLFKKLDQYGEAIIVLNELKKFAKDEAEKAKINSDLVEVYLKQGCYDDAVLALDMLMCLPDANSYIDEKLYLQVHIDGGIDALKKGDFEVARLRLRNGLDFTKDSTNPGKIQSEENDGDCKETKNDLFILCNERVEEYAVQLMFLFNQLGLKASFNYDDVAPVALKNAGLCASVKHSNHLIIVCDNESLTETVLFNFEMAQSIILGRGYGHTVVLTTSQNVKMPSLLLKYPNVIMTQNIAQNEDVKFYENGTLVKSVKELLYKLALGKDSVPD